MESKLKSLWIIPRFIVVIAGNTRLNSENEFGQDMFAGFSYLIYTLLFWVFHFP